MTHDTIKGCSNAKSQQTIDFFLLFLFFFFSKAGVLELGGLDIHIDVHPVQ